MKKYIGDKAFYKLVLFVALPMMLQNGITSFVGLLDNIMVGRVGTEPMSGVAIVNQLFFVFNLSIFGALSGAGIYTAQYYGQQNNRGIRSTFRFKALICTVICAVTFVLIALFKEPLIRLFLHDAGTGGDLEATFRYGVDYLNVLCWSCVPFAVTQLYSGTLRECKQTLVPMIAGIVGVLVNMVFNYLLIFGKFGFPVMGVKGAALATVLSRVVEAGIVIVWTHSHKRENMFVIGAFKSAEIPLPLVKDILKKGTPLMINEFLWSVGMTTLTQLYSLKGLAVISAISITNTLSNLFGVVFISLGSSVGIIVGNLLGAGDFEKAVDYDRKLIAFSVFTCIVIGSAMALTNGLFPKLYNTTPEVKQLASQLIVIVGLFMPLHGYTHAAYFTLRCGGKTLITFLFDSVYCWVVVIPTIYVVVHKTSLSMVSVYAVCQSLDFVKCFIGAVLIEKRLWVNNLLGGEKKSKLAAGLDTN